MRCWSRRRTVLLAVAAFTVMTGFGCGSLLSINADEEQPPQGTSSSSSSTSSSSSSSGSSSGTSGGSSSGGDSGGGDDAGMTVAQGVTIAPTTITLTGHCGQTVTKQITITNDRDKAVTWTAQPPSTPGITVSPLQQAALASKSVATINVSIVYPSMMSVLAKTSSQINITVILDGQSPLVTSQVLVQSDPQGALIVFDPAVGVNFGGASTVFSPFEVANTGNLPITVALGKSGTRDEAFSIDPPDNLVIPASNKALLTLTYISSAQPASATFTPQLVTGGPLCNAPTVKFTGQ